MSRKEITDNVRKETISFMSFHDIDMATRKATPIDVSAAEDLKEYIAGKLKYIIDHSKNCREFKLSETDSDTYEKIIQSLTNIHDNDFLNEQSNLLAKKLITKQNHTTSDGGLVQAIFMHDTTYYYAFIKNEFEDVIGRSDMKKIDAFIYGDKAPLKTGLFEIIEQDENNPETPFYVKNIFVDDSQTSPFAQFWYRDFLNLIPKLDNEFSTINFLEAAENFWSKVDEDVLVDINNLPDSISEGNVKENIGALRFELYNQTKGFMVDKKTFRLDEYLNILDKDLLGFQLDNIDLIKHEFNEMADDDNFGFGKVFDIDKPTLNKKRYSFAYSPQKNIRLSISGKVDNNLVYINKDNDNDQYILNIVVDPESDPDILKHINIR